jgi:hypothetical protein
MKTVSSCFFVVSLFFGNFDSYAGLSNPISYQLEELGQGRWKAIYEVHNISLSEPLREFTLWYDYGLYSNLTIETTTPLNTAWSERIFDPYRLPPLTPFHGFYDALASDTGIAAGQWVSGFAVSFDWLGSGVPGSQRYEILDPETYETLIEGQTVYIPEPATGLLLILSCAYLRKNPNKN